MLTVEEYNKEEMLAKKRISSFVLQAFQPTTFFSVGYNSYISDEEELWKFVDTMQELRFERNVLDGLSGGLTRDEFNLFSAVSEKIYRYSSNLGSPSFGRNSLTRSLIAFRALRTILSVKAKPTVLEIGPGTGYLGALCTESEFCYLATDVSQNFYCYQNAFWNFTYPNLLNEMVHEVDFKDGNYINHLPWWRWCDLSLKLPHIDVVTCNHVLSEMHIHSLIFLIKRVVESANLRREDPPLFVFEGWGYRSFGPLLSIFQRNGYSLLHHGVVGAGSGRGDSPVTILAYKKEVNQIKRRLSFQENLPFWSKSKLFLKCMIKSHILRIPLEHYFLSNMYFSCDDPYSIKLSNFNTDDIKYGLPDILKLYDSLDNSVPKFSKDEKFALYLNVSGL